MPSELRAPVPFQPAGSSSSSNPKVDESQYHSRLAFKDKKTRFKAQSLARWEHWCRIHQVKQQDFFNALMDDAFERLLNTGILPGSGTESGNLGTRSPAAEAESGNLSGNLGTHSAPKSGNLGTHTTDLDRSDLMIDDRSHQSIDLFPESGNLGTRSPAERAKEDAVMAFYQAKTGNRVKGHDRKAYHEGYTNRCGEYRPGVADVQLHLIRRGILESIERCPEGFGRFAYCLGAIHQLVEDSRREEARAVDERINQLRIKAETRGNQQPLPSTGDGADLGTIASKAKPVWQPPNELTAAFHETLVGKISPESFATWFLPALLRIEGELLIISVPNVVIRNWLRTNYSTLLVESLAEVQIKIESHDLFEGKRNRVRWEFREQRIASNG